MCFEASRQSEKALNSGFKISEKQYQAPFACFNWLMAECFIPGRRHRNDKSYSERLTRRGDRVQT